MRTSFPILLTLRERRHSAALDCPPSVPWRLVEPHEDQALKNHNGQSLARLAERGGLGPDELVAVLEDRQWTAMPLAESVVRIRAILWSAPDEKGTGGGR